MEVGTSVGTCVDVASWVAVGVSLGVGLTAASNVPAGAIFRSEKNTMDAATTITTARTPTAAGKLKVTAGIRLA